MASGFIVLPDGRCFSRRWSAHDLVLRAVAEQVDDAPLRQWLLDQLPGPDDEEELGYGAWGRASDNGTVRRFIDVRLMTPENQRLFCDAAKHAASAGRDNETQGRCLCDLADMVYRMERGEPPLSKSDWVRVVPPEGGRIGPGWG
jgi:hypothetical protein